MNKAKYTALINQLTDRELLKNVYMTQVILIIVAFILHIIVFHSNPPLLKFLSMNEQILSLVL